MQNYEHLQDLSKPVKNDKSSNFTFWLSELMTFSSENAINP